MRGVLTTTLIVTRVAKLIPIVPHGLLRVSLRCSRALLTPSKLSCECAVVLCRCGALLDGARRRVFPN
jgi:hypothetical protein